MLLSVCSSSSSNLPAFVTCRASHKARNPRTKKVAEKKVKSRFRGNSWNRSKVGPKVGFSVPLQGNLLSDIRFGYFLFGGILALGTSQPCLPNLSKSWIWVGQSYINGSGELLSSYCASSQWGPLGGGLRSRSGHRCQGGGLALGNQWKGGHSRKVGGWSRVGTGTKVSRTHPSRDVIFFGQFWQKKRQKIFCTWRLGALQTSTYTSHRREWLGWLGFTCALWRHFASRTARLDL